MENGVPGDSGCPSVAGGAGEFRCCGGGGCRPPPVFELASGFFSGDVADGVRMSSNDARKEPASAPDDDALAAAAAAAVVVWGGGINAAIGPISDAGES